MHNRIAALIFVLAFSAALSAQSSTPPQFMAAFGGGNVKGKWIGRSLDLGGKYENDICSRYFGSKLLRKPLMRPERAMISFRNYAVNYKVYTLFGEPVFDFQFLWEDATDIYPSFNYARADKSAVSVPSEISKFPADLRARIAKLRPISVKFMVSLSDKSYFKKLEFNAGNTVKNYEARTDLGPMQAGAYGVKGVRMLASDWAAINGTKKFSVDVPEVAGKWQTYSVPGSPDWKELPSYFKNVFKARKNADDLFVSDITVAEIEWPEFEIESVVSDYINRVIAERRRTALASEDFWNKPLTNAELPVKTSAAPASSAEKRAESRSAQDKAAEERYKTLEAIGKAPATIEILNVNKMKLSLHASFGAAELVLVDKSGKERGRASAPAGGKPIELASVPGLYRIDVYRKGEKIGSIPWTYLDASKGIVELSSPKGPYRVQVSVNGREVFSADCRNGPQKHLFALPAGYSPEKLPELLVTTSGFGSYVTGRNRDLVAYEKREAAKRKKKMKPGVKYITFGPRSYSYACVESTVEFGKTVFRGRLAYSTSGGRAESFSDFNREKINLRK